MDPHRKSPKFPELPSFPLASIPQCAGIGDTLRTILWSDPSLSTHPQVFFFFETQPMKKSSGTASPAGFGTRPLGTFDVPFKIYLQTLISFFFSPTPASFRGPQVSRRHTILPSFSLAKCKRLYAVRTDPPPPQNRAKAAPPFNTFFQST